MKIFIYNLDRNNEALNKSLNNVFIDRNELLSFGKITSEVISKNNGFYIDATDREVSLILTVVKMVAKATMVSYWITDYGDNFKFITLRKKTEFHKFPVKAKVSQEMVDDLKTSITGGKPKINRLEKIKLNELKPTEGFKLEVKYNSEKPFSLAILNDGKKLIKIPKDSWLKIEQGKFLTNSNEIKNILTSNGFEYDENIQDS